ncbi:diacylglycerol kinase [Gottschalkia purinilytica]|uniref:Diacylglycerol kinase n=1 Tax=Gottschalkia purinilytica TaxID=1503 RepID=A0A0L0W6E7_GOTPU|nr:diacylglycerol kinase family protein [Gottschalkia purinilytica]KNF07094.1 diacylglycerol kinase [Gottschalkia purinilytica]
MKVLFIVNPVAGKTKAKKLIPVIEEYIGHNIYIDYEIVETERAGQATEITIQGIEKGYDTIVAVGGDGTINEVANGIISRKKGTLGIIPGGTGNDLARSLNIPMDTIQALSYITNPNVKQINIGKANDKLFLNVSSIGIDADIVKNTQKIKKHIKSKFAYTLGLLKTIVSYKIKKFEIKLDNKEIERDALLVAIGNGSNYGGGMKICPMALMDDGYFDVCIIKDVNKIKLLALFPIIFKGRHEEIKKYVEFYRCKTVKINFKNSINLNIDGEVLKVEDESIFEICDEKLSIICS